ncbi:MAG: transglutaminase family protein, partial [Pseudomonadota bacterium]
RVVVEDRLPERRRLGELDVASDRRLEDDCVGPGRVRPARLFEEPLEVGPHLAGQQRLAVAVELCARIYEDFDYSPGATGADTLPGVSFAARHGVCQDFAHVMLACLRASRLPARYVSGYLRTIPPEGQPRLEGADASHAWVSVWDPVLDWVDLDPTNNLVPGIDHVTLAWGRDFRDVSPVSGLVVGSGPQVLSVGVDVAPLADAA